MFIGLHKHRVFCETIQQVRPLHEVLPSKQKHVNITQGPSLYPIPHWEGGKIAHHVVGEPLGEKNWHECLGGSPCNR